MKCGPFSQIRPHNYCGQRVVVYNIMRGSFAWEGHVVAPLLYDNLVELHAVGVQSLDMHGRVIANGGGGGGR